jgi:ABC-2 type transport system permease protein
MSKVGVIYRKELQYYFQSITAYVMIGLFLALSGYFFYSIFRYYNYLSYQAGRDPYLAGSLNLIEGVMRRSRARSSFSSPIPSGTSR